MMSLRNKILALVGLADHNKLHVKAAVLLFGDNGSVQMELLMMCDEGILMLNNDGTFSSTRRNPEVEDIFKAIREIVNG